MIHQEIDKNGWFTCGKRKLKISDTMRWEDAQGVVGHVDNPPVFALSTMDDSGAYVNLCILNVHQESNGKAVKYTGCLTMLPHRAGFEDYNVEVIAKTVDDKDTAEFDDKLPTNIEKHLDRIRLLRSDVL